MQVTVTCSCVILDMLDSWNSRDGPAGDAMLPLCTADQTMHVHMCTHMYIHDTYTQTDECYTCIRNEVTLMGNK